MIYHIEIGFIRVCIIGFIMRFRKYGQIGNMNESKSLLINSIFNVSYKLINILFPFMMIVYVSRIIMPEGIGKVTVAQNILSYFSVVAPLGIPTYGIKKIAENRNNKVKLNIVFSELMIINFLSTIVCSVSYLVLITNVDYFRERIVLYIVVGISLLFNVFNVDWFYQGIEEYGYIMIRNALVKIIAMLLVILFVKDIDDYLIYALISSGSLVANYAFNAIHIRKFVKFSLKSVKVRKHFKPIFLLLASTIAIEIYTLVDTTMLAFLCGEEIVGFYSNATKVIKALRGIIIAGCAVFLPRMSYCFLDNEFEFKRLIKIGYKVLVILSLPVALGLILTSRDLIILLFGSAFAESVILSQILSVSIISVALSGFFGNQVFVVVGLEKKILESTILGAIINIVMNFFLIKSYGAIGAAIASVITECGVVLYQMIIVRKTYFPCVVKQFYFSVVFSAVTMCMLIIFINAFVENTIVRLVLDVVGGGFMYCLCLFITKNSVMEGCR